MTEKYNKLISFYNPSKEWRCISCERLVDHPKNKQKLKSKFLRCNDYNSRICVDCLKELNVREY